MTQESNRASAFIWEKGDLQPADNMTPAETASLFDVELEEFMATATPEEIQEALS